MSIGNSPEDDRPSVEPSAEDDRPSIGRALQQARIDAGLTVDEVSTSTRVRIPIVQAIEQDDFSRCGGDVYARGHIRTLARAVGLDPDPFVAQYDADHGGRPSPTPAAPLFEAERIRPERRRPNWTAAMVAAIVAVVGFVGFTLFNGGDDGGSDSQVAEGSTPEQKPSPPKATTKPADPKPDPSDSAIAAVPKDKVTVKLSVLDDKSWISAKSHNGKLLFDGTLLKGESKTFQDDERVDLIIGNAGAIELFVNGKRVEDEFETGQVERLSYTKGDPAVG
ncbi:helix-turn-helix domain-containing protein [Streptomyces lunaelactis]|uniref:helix-turn-helix domain-containing protein n=1 Tax=Streptomyces lunaelactis TaxID=1535768 RepID=UPI0015847ED3|nr:helix-turn-helix domain-containing protein [Streptomyces lunaelactis]NUK04131.1 helix-turn-helix domain-containing protein [Streptomyces lunaelactis]NUK11004.1 helix-turn-helix domain-containing protein [Streptomyces lunaelactis]NUK18817.1 helix-turn-helix domain-containing protein [Streptomyces lunaelactis]NUK25897.1 helix-turn-helix domain-containing protein [Streptomyces lunaelactis]NUK37346.1 helix-turn-helix domain-containing protein [Streptomyces lunaelactis]